MRTLRTSVVRLGAITALSALALIANPALSSAAVAGSASVRTEGSAVVVDFSGISSPTLILCWVQVKTNPGAQVDGNPVALTGNPGAGTYVSARLDNGLYMVEALCLDGSGITTLTPPGGKWVTVNHAWGSSDFGSSDLGSSDQGSSNLGSSNLGSSDTGSAGGGNATGSLGL